MASATASFFSLVFIMLTNRVISTASDSQATPISKVLQLLNDMAVKGDAEKKLEEDKFAAFSQWCEDQVRVKTNEIKAANSQIEMLDARIQKANVRIQQLTDRTNELSEDVGRWEKDQKSVTAVRSKETADYRLTVQDYTESIDAITAAIAVLKKQAYTRGQAELLQSSLVQVRNLQLVPLATKKTLSAFLQQAQSPDERLFNEAPEAAGYEFQSGGVIEMLEKLKDEFSTKKMDLDAEELKAQHAYEQILQQLIDNTENANHEISKKNAESGETGQVKASATGDLTATTSDRDEDQKYLDDTKALCATKKADFESRQKLRAEELATIKKAIDIISSEAVQGAGDKHLPALLQKSKHVALTQLRGDQRNPLQDRIAVFLAGRAQSINSRLLTLVSQRVSTDPFTKVKKMIKDLIVKLMEEGTSETEHKGWCDTEIATNKVTRDSKTEEVDKLRAQVEDLTSTIAKLTQSVQDLTAAFAELDVAMASATQDRNEAKEKNAQTITEAKDAQTGITQAIALIKDFYANSGEATAFTQQTPAEDAPETFNSSYKGMLPEGGNVVDFLEVILSDFNRLESETSASEASEQETYEKYMFESKKDRALKENEMEHKKSKIVDKESDLHSTKAELEATKDQLDKAIAYYEKLKPNCVDSGITYEERAQRREEEIQSLQEALKILTGTDVDLA